MTTKAKMKMKTQTNKQNFLGKEKSDGKLNSFPVIAGFLSMFPISITQMYEHKDVCELCLYMLKFDKKYKFVLLYGAEVNLLYWY